MQTFSTSSNNNYEFEKMLKEKEALQEEKRKVFKKRFKIFLIIFIIISFIALCIYGISKIPKSVLMSEDNYEIYSLEVDNDNSAYLNITYIDTDASNKICQKSMYHDDIFKIIHLSNDKKNYVTVQKYGHDEKVKKRKITKFYITEETYKELSKNFEWDGKSN